MQTAEECNDIVSGSICFLWIVMALGCNLAFSISVFCTHGYDPAPTTDSGFAYLLQAISVDSEGGAACDELRLLDVIPRKQLPPLAMP
jgi:hypothetical protein